MFGIYEVYYRDKTIKVKADKWKLDSSDQTICFYLRSSIVACFNFNNIIGIKEIGEVKS